MRVELPRCFGALGACVRGAQESLLVATGSCQIRKVMGKSGGGGCPKRILILATGLRPRREAGSYSQRVHVRGGEVLEFIDPGFPAVRIGRAASRETDDPARLSARLPARLPACLPTYLPAEAWHLSNPSPKRSSSRLPYQDAPC